MKGEDILGLFTPQSFQKNLAMLEFFNPELAHRLIQTPVERPDAELVISPEGIPDVVVKLRNRPRSVHPGPDPMARAHAVLENQGLEQAREVVLFGLGLGFELQALFERLPRNGRVRVYEPDLSLMCLCFSRLDMSELLLDGRLSFYTGPGLTQLVQEVSLETFVVVQPGLAPLLKWEVRTFQNLLRDRFQQLEASLGDASLPSSLIEVQAERSRPLRIGVVFGGLFFEDLAHTWLERGDAVHVFHPELLTHDEIVADLRRIQPDLVISVDLVNGLGRLCAQAGVPYVVWEINPRVWVVPRATPDEARWTHFFTWRKKHVPLYLALGFEHVSWLPLAANPDFRRPLPVTPDQRERYRAPVSFVGSSLVNEDAKDLRLAQETLRTLTQEAPTAGERRAWMLGLNVIKQALDAQQQDVLRPIFVEMLEAGFEQLGLPVMLPVGKDLLDLRIVFSRIFGTRRRNSALQVLAPVGVAVYGDPGWQKVLGQGLYYRGSAEHGEELTLIYNISLFNLDIGRLYQLDIVTMRVFDILASGGFALVEYAEELPDLFDVGREIIAWQDARELLEFTLHFLEHPEQRLDVIQAGRARVLREHTFHHRLETIVQTLRARGVLKDPPGPGQGAPGR